MHRVFRLLHLLDGGEGLVVLARELALKKGEDVDLAVGGSDEGGGVGEREMQVRARGWVLVGERGGGRERGVPS